MDPWSNHLNQAYGRLTPGTGLSANSTFHLLAEQQGFGTAAGLGASLSSPLPAHAALPTAAARFSSLSHMNYSALHGSMTPLFDPMALSQGFAGSSSAYKTVPVVQTMYSLDPSGSAQSTGSVSSLHESLGGRFVSQASQSKAPPPALFSVDQQVALSDNTSGGLSGGSGNTVGGAGGGATSQWSRPGGFSHSALANPYEGMSAGRSGSNATPSAGGAKSKQQEPPPAHSGSRSSALHRSSGAYPNKDFHAQQQSQQQSSPQPSAQISGRSNRAVTSYESTNQESIPPSAHVSMQQLANLEFVQKLILDGQKLHGDVASGVGGAGGKQVSSRNVAEGQRNSLAFAVSPEPQRMTPSGAGRVIQQQGQQVYAGEQHQQQGLQQVGGYALSSGYSDRGGSAGTSASGSHLMYSASPALVEQQYDSISSPELLSRDHQQQTSAAAAILSQQSLGRFSGLDSSAAAQVMHVTLQDAVALAAVVNRNQLQGNAVTGGNEQRGGVSTPGMLAVQALPDSTTKPKRNRNSGKAAGANRVNQLEISQPVGNMRPDDLGQPMDKEANKRKGKGGGGKGKNRREDGGAGTSGLQDEVGGFNQQQQQQSGGAAYTQLLPSSASFSSSQADYSGGDVEAYRQQQQQKLSYQASLMSQVSAMMFPEGNRSTAADEPQVFMTNMYGNAFVNPNEVLSIDSNLNTMLVGGGQVTASTSGASVDSAEDPNASCDSRPKTDSLTPRPRPVPSIIDEDFGHLTDDPDPQSKAEAAPKPAAGPSEPTGFMNSFLSFVQGKKPDTLQTAAAATVKKPVLPKYVPDITPRRPIVETPKPNSVVVSTPGVSNGGVTGIKPAGGTFSTVRSGPTIQQVSPSASTSGGRGNPTVVGSAAKGSTAERKVTGGSKGRPGRGRHLKDEDEDDTEDDEAPQSKKSAGVTQKGGKKTEVVVPTRERSSRKAKEKVEQKRKAKAGKRKASVYAEDEDELGDLDDLSPLPAGGGGDDTDSDNDPVWNPSLKAARAERSRRLTEDSADFSESKTQKRKGRRGRGGDITTLPENVIQTPGLGTAKQNSEAPAAAAAAATTAAPKYEFEVPEDEERPHNYEKGNFLIDRRDLGNHLSYPIWKIDAGRLLQKYEATEKDGRLIHRSLTTYSSWSGEIERSHRAIDVIILSSNRTLELVEVLEQYRPKPPSAARLEAENVRDSFNVFVQILVSQALEPTFLGALFNDGDEYYMNPLRNIEGLLSERTALISTSLNWTQQFKDAINKYSSYDLVDIEGKESEVINTTERLEAVKQIRLYGAAYDDQNLTILEELPSDQAVEYAVEKRSATVLPLYHSIHHIKWSMCKTCRAKIEEVRTGGPELVDHEVLDKCLQMTEWMQELFQRFVDLLEGVDQWKEQKTNTE